MNSGNQKIENFSVLGGAFRCLFGCFEAVSTDKPSYKYSGNFKGFQNNGFFAHVQRSPKESQDYCQHNSATDKSQLCSAFYVISVVITIRKLGGYTCFGNIFLIGFLLLVQLKLLFPYLKLVFLEIKKTLNNLRRHGVTAMTLLVVVDYSSSPLDTV